jgi:hypothetical protein
MLRVQPSANFGLLERVLVPDPECLLVLSTSWSTLHGLHSARKSFGHKLPLRVIGATFHSRMNLEDFDNKLRGMQVYEDVLRRKPAQWF